MSQGDWTQEFVEKGQYFLKILNAKWPKAETTVQGIVKILEGNEIKTGKILDLCCGNGRLAIWLANKGFKVVGIDLSPLFIEDALRRVSEHGVESKVKFFVGDVRKVDEIVGSESPFDCVISFWTSIGFWDDKTDEMVFTKAREMTRKGGILIIGDCSHRDLLTQKFVPRRYTEYEDMVILEESEFDSLSSRLKMTWKYYAKEESDLKFLDALSFHLRIYSVNEIASILEKAGWKTIKAYGNLKTLQPFSALTSMNLVARAV